jgi:fumarate reductase flavoprotein subunit
VEAQAEDERRRIAALLDGPGTQRGAALRDQMQATMEEAAGIFRTGKEMAKGADTLAELQERIGNVGLADTSRSFNTELLAALELSHMLDISECILRAGMQREESRGAHQRTDFPARDDERFLTHLLVYRNPDGTSRVERSPVTITRWPPGERVYGR